MVAWRDLIVQHYAVCRTKCLLKERSGKTVNADKIYWLHEGTWLLNIMLYAELNIDWMKGMVKTVNADKIYWLHEGTWLLNIMLYAELNVYWKKGVVKL